MTKRILGTFFLLLMVCSGAYAGLSEEQRRDNGILSSAVAFASDKVIGEFGLSIPDGFDGEGFMVFIKDRVPDDYYDALRSYSIIVYPKGNYYLLVARERQSDSIVLFDYSCTPKVDGPVFLEPSKYELSRLAQYDECKIAH